MSPVMSGVKVGPLDPDKTAEFGQVSANASARQLIRLHTQAHPAALTRALALKLDDPRTKAVLENLDEVADYVGGLKHENGDPVLPEGATIEGASIRGQRDKPQVLTFTFRLPSGRTAKWFAEYGENDLPTSWDLGNEYARVQHLRDRGLVPFDDEGTHTELLRREASGLRRQNAALRATIEGRDAGEEEPETKEVPGATRADDQIVAENEELRRTVRELTERVGQLQSAVEANATRELRGAGGAEPEDAGGAESVASEDEPFEGYDELNARDIADRLKSEDTSDEERQAVLDYERTHANRRSVVGAAEHSLGARGAA